MVNNISQIVNHLFKRESLEEVPESELRFFVKQYPYSGTGHLLLAKKLQLDGEKRALERETSVASIYFSNPAWLRYLLDSTNGEPEPKYIRSETGSTVQTENFLTDSALVEPVEKHVETISPVVIKSSSGSEMVSVDETSTEINPVIAFIESLDNDKSGDSKSIAEFNEEPPLGMAADVSEGSVRVVPDVGPATIITVETEPVEENSATVTGAVTGVSESPAELTIEDKLADAEPVEEKSAAVQSADIKPDTPGVLEAGISEALPEKALTDEAPAKESFPAQPVEDKASSIPAFTLSNPLKDPKTGEALPKLEFDPYHTIDYFASQGIKLRTEDYSRDKLGQQLKSFTEWIRSMKRLPQQPADQGLNESDQQSIRRIAEHSVEEKEVLTESMAEVWAKQGNPEKARQIYRKLSLQNPSKSSYFAAKIEQLNSL